MGTAHPTMAKDLPEYVKAVKEKNLKCFMYCNGAKLNGKFMRDVVDAGIDFIRISVIGYNKEKYNQWMNADNFDLIISNLKELKQYVNESKYNCKVSTYHLILDPTKVMEEINEYKNNITSFTPFLGFLY